MEKNITKHYTNGEVTVVWKPHLCIHSSVCWNKDGLPQVFNPRERPWIKPEGAGSEQIVEQVKKCPSGALSYYYNNTMQDHTDISSETKIEAVVNGPLLVYGNVHIKDSRGNELKKSNVTAFCRCGQSGNKPFCDGSHVTHNFEG